MLPQAVLVVLVGYLACVALGAEQTYHRKDSYQKKEAAYSEYAHGLKKPEHRYDKRTFPEFKFSPGYRHSPVGGYPGFGGGPFGGFYLPGYPFVPYPGKGQGYAGHGKRSRGYKAPSYSIHDKSYHISEPHNPRPTHTKKAKKYDPCHDKPEGDYILEGVFRDYFSGTDPQCNFVKCANNIAFTNPCSIGTKNDKNGHGFCSHLDHHYYCGYPAANKVAKGKH